MKLFINAFAKFLAGFLTLSLLIFVPAGGLDYTNGWLFLALLFLPMLTFGIFLLIKNPEVLEKRLETNEKESVQKWVILLSAILFVGGFVFAGLDFQFKWSTMHNWLVCLFSVTLISGYVMYMKTILDNEHISRVVRVEEGQRVVDTGLYKFVRHPMYLSTIIIFLSIPFVLKSWVSLIWFTFYPFVIALRIVNEEKFLEENLKGYKEYKNKVKYRLFPFVW